MLNSRTQSESTPLILRPVSIPTWLMQVSESLFIRTDAISQGYCNDDDFKNYYTANCHELGTLLNHKNEIIPLEIESTENNAAESNNEAIDYDESDIKGPLCFICCCNVPDCVLMECGHSGLCFICATNVSQGTNSAQINQRVTKDSSKCPICRGAIETLFRLSNYANFDGKKVYYCDFGN